MAIKPIHDYIVVKKTEAKNAAGIYLSAPADPAAPRYAEVISVGPGRPADNTGVIIPMPDIKAQELVLMHGGAGIRLTDQGEDVWAIMPRDIIAVQVA